MKNTAVIEGNESWGAQAVCNTCFANGSEHLQYSCFVKLPLSLNTYGDDTEEGDSRFATLKKKYKIHVLDPVGEVVESHVNHCMGCNVEFGFFLRKYHCSCCGNVMCSVRSCDLSFICFLVL